MTTELRRSPLLRASTKPSLTSATNVPALGTQPAADPERAAERAARLGEVAARHPEPLGDVADVAGVDAGHDAADDGDAEGAAHLAGGVVDGGTDAGLLPRQRAHDRLRRRRHRHAHADGHEAEQVITIGYGVVAPMNDSDSRAVEMISRPVVTTRLVPRRSTTRADIGATTIIVSA